MIAYAPDEAILQLRRPGVSGSLPVGIATVVRTGDEITLPAQSTLTVEFADNRQIVSSGPGTWMVPPAPSIGFLAALFHRVEFSMAPNDVRVATAITRSSQSCEAASVAPIAVPAWRPNARVIAGRRGLSLAWTGGCPPYQVELRAGEHLIASQSAVKVAEVRFDDLTLAPGVMTLAIKGARGAPASFSIVVAAHQPMPPRALIQDPSHLAQIARALWLADIEDGRWRLDAVELLARPAGSGDTMAAYEIKRLLWIKPPH